MTLTPLTPAEQSQNNIQDLKTEFSSSSRNNSNTLGFDLSNTFEAKVTDKDSTRAKKIMLLNNLNLSHKLFRCRWNYGTCLVASSS
jgi:hypothetical protein